MAMQCIEGLKKRLKRDSDLHTKYTEQLEAIIFNTTLKRLLKTKLYQINASGIFHTIRSTIQKT